VLRFRLAQVDGMTDAAWPRVSPDGKALLLMVAASSGTAEAAVRRLDQVDVHVVPGTQGLLRPYWSPDGKEVVFVANGKLQRVALDGGSPVVICDAASGADVSWGAKGKVLLDGSGTDSLMVVSAGGGTLEPATRIDHAHGELGAAWPSFLPDGEHFLFIGTTVSGAGTIRLGKLGSLESKAIGKSDGRAEWAPGDWVLFLQGTNLMAQKLDLGAGKLVGAPKLVADRLRVGTSSGHFSTSPNGFLAYAIDEGAGQLRLMTMNRAGTAGPKVVTQGSVWNPSLSPDGKQMLLLHVMSQVQGLGEIYSIDLARGTETRLTFTNNTALDGVWSPDGRRIAVGTVADDGTITVRLVAADGLGAQDTIVVGKSTTGYSGLTQWSPDGTRIVGFKNRKVWTLPVEGSSRAISYPIDSTLFATQGEISPDGRWLAVTSGTTTAVRAYVYGIGDTSGRIQLSSDVSFRPHWTKGGREIVFESAKDLWAVDVDTKNGFRAGTPHRLFALPLASPNPGFVSWDVDASGETFYVLAPTGESHTQIEVVSDFRALVSRR
jgi:Tol biopolymer transport system component